MKYDLDLSGGGKLNPSTRSYKVCIGDNEKEIGVKVLHEFGWISIRVAINKGLKGIMSKGEELDDGEYKIRATDQTGKKHEIADLLCLENQNIFRELTKAWQDGMQVKIKAKDEVTEFIERAMETVVVKEFKKEVSK